MGTPGAKQGDKVVAVDTHVVLVPSPGGPVPTPTPMPFNGKLSGSLCTKIFIDNKAAAVVGSTAQNSPAHIPTGGSFQSPPSNQATVKQGSNTSFFENKGAARMGDPAMTCNDPSDAPIGTVIASGTVLIGG